MSPSAWSIAILAAVVGTCPATAQAQDTTAWQQGRRFASRIQATIPALADSDRTRYLATYAALRAVRDSLTAVERVLIGRLTADRAALRRLADSTATQERARGIWQDSLSAHNTRCRRSFTDPADVRRCDAAGEKLASDGASLDSWQERIEARRKDLGDRQRESRASAVELDERGTAVTRRLIDEFNAPLQRVLAQRSSATTLRVTGKSFIKRVDLSSISAEGRKLTEFARFSNFNFSENPATPSPDVRDYRLWSQVNVVAACREDTLVWWRSSHLAHRGGREAGVLDAETSILQPLQVAPSARQSGAASLSVSYAIKGKPNDATLSSFQQVRPRTCHSIWHRVAGTVTCQRGKALLEASIAGSVFPSHRVWTDSTSRPTIEQGPFATLWECDPASPLLVR